jgi:hypothetical protein
MEDNPGVYRLSGEEPPRRRRYIPPPGADPVPDETDDRAGSFDRSMAFDPFPVILIVAVVVWIGLGLATRAWPWAGLILAAVGLLVCLVSKVYLYLLILREDPRHGWLSVVSKWHRLLYLYQNPELTWRPMVVAGCGLLMILTGVFLLLTKLKPGGP